jgi:hypothetical protein
MAGDPLNRGFFAATNTALLLVGADGGTRELISAQERIGPLIADERYVYWSQPMQAQIFKRDWQSGAVTVVASAVVAGAMAQTANDVFWAEYDRNHDVGSIKRISKTLP